SSTSSSSGGDPCGGACVGGATCGTANGLPVCRAPSGIPAFSHVFVIVMENFSLSTLQTAMSSNGAPNLKAMASKYATGSDYHGVAHPSLPNYIALTSGDTQGIACDCKAVSGPGDCASFIDCSLGNCPCANLPAMHLGDQLEIAQKSWMDFGEGMGTPCNLTDNAATKYAVRHVPFLYYDNVEANAARCNAHVVDFSAFDPNSAANFNFIAPNLTNDMHDPSLLPPAGPQNILNGDMWIGPQVDAIMASMAYTKGGLLVVVWDEDDGSGGLLKNTDDPIGIFVMSPYAKSPGFVSAVKADHYSLLATIEDGLGLPRLGKAAAAQPLADYFPAN
ncbi:MAG TPA: alkaline phosphatase family protein, partial [Polyangiaceae bacterium]